MELNTRMRHVAAWVACFAILLAALAPTVSRVLAAGGPQSYQTDAGSVTGQGLVHEADHPAHDSSTQVKKELHFEHCPFCLVHAGSFGLPPTAGFILPAASGSPVFPILFYQSSRPLFVWATPQSRAPPAYS